MSRMQQKEKFYGEIGKNIPVNRAEKEEDLLERIYLHWKAGEFLQPDQLMEEAGIRNPEMENIRKRMVRHGYLDAEEAERGKLVLTEFGINQGAECYYRHKNLTQFLQMISGIDYENAEENACRLEHFVDKKIISGIVNFVRYGNVYDQMLKNYDLNDLFDVGNYQVCMSLYEPEKRSPRILAAEHVWFDNEPVLEVREQGSRFLLRPRNKRIREVYYRKNGEWVKMRHRSKAFILPTNVFEYIVSPSLPTIEGTVLIAVITEEREPSDADCRELNMHICQ